MGALLGVRAWHAWGAHHRPPCRISHAALRGLKRASVRTSRPFCEAPQEAYSELGQHQRRHSRLRPASWRGLQQIGHFSTDCGEPVATRDPLCTSNHPADSECTGTPSPARFLRVRIAISCRRPLPRCQTDAMPRPRRRGRVEPPPPSACPPLQFGPHGCFRGEHLRGVAPNGKVEFRIAGCLSWPDRAVRVCSHCLSPVRSHALPSLLARSPGGGASYGGDLVLACLCGERATRYAATCCKRGRALDRH